MMDNTRQKHKVIIIVSVIAVVLVVAVLISILVIRLLGVVDSSAGDRGNLLEHYAYFVPESTKSDTKYALVDKDGKKLTEYNIEKFDQFVDGYTIVKTTEGWGIMDDSGKMTIKPNEYDALSRVGGLYTALEPGLSERKLLHGSGRVVTTYSPILNVDLKQQNSFGDKYAMAVAIKRDDNTYDIYNASGNKVKSIKTKKAPVISTLGMVNWTRNKITSVSYDGGLILISNSDLKVVHFTDKARRIYHLAGASYDSTQLTFKEVKGKTNDNTSSNSAIYINGLFKEIGDKCDYLNVNSTEFNPTGYISCNSARSKGFFDSRGELRRSSDLLSDKSYAIIDSSHYASYYRGGTAQIGNKSIDSVVKITTSGRNFVVQSGTKHIVYDNNGVKICVLPSGYSSFSGFNSDGVGILNVYGGQNDSAYLINKSCSKVSSGYDSISVLGDKLFVAKTLIVNSTTNLPNAYGYSLIDKTGSEIIKTGEYQSFSRTGYYDGTVDFIVGKKVDGSSVLFDSNLKKITDFKGSHIFDNAQSLLRVYDEKFITYYSLDGVELHSVEIGEWARPRT